VNWFVWAIHVNEQIHRFKSFDYVYDSVMEIWLLLAHDCYFHIN